MNLDETELEHPNTMDLKAYKDGELIDEARIFSVGGGRIVIKGQAQESAKDVYELSSFHDIADYCMDEGIRIWQYVEQTEDEDFPEYMMDVWQHMKSAVQRGLKDEGTLPGGLNVQKKARRLLSAEHIDETAETRENRLVSAYAFAVGEQNASGETIVTAPTCGSCGVIPSILYYMQFYKGFTEDEIIDALAVAGLIGNVIATNASISGAECGCQAEIGSASGMAAVISVSIKPGATALTVILREPIS